MNKNDIQEAANQLATLLRKENADPTYVESILSTIRSKALPTPSQEEVEAHQRVEDALGAQRAVALLRTEARLHAAAAERCESVVQRLENTQDRLMKAAAQDASQDNNNAASARTALVTQDEAIPAATASRVSQEDVDRFRTSVLNPIAAEAAKRNDQAQQARDAAIQKENEFVRLRRCANESVAILVRQTERNFNQVFQEALGVESAVESANMVNEICGDVGRENDKKHHSQLVPDEFSLTSPKYLAHLREQAQERLKTGGDFRSLVTQIANKYGGTATLAPVKGYKRTVEKVQEKYGGNYSKVLDLARGMVVFDTIPQLSNALEYIKKAHDEREEDMPLLVRAKDRLSPRFNASRYTGGYRDVLLNLHFSGHIVELQLHVATFLELKNWQGHHVYEEARCIHMFNESFTGRSFRWMADSNETEVEELLEDIRSGVLTSLDLDYSDGLWDPEAQAKLAEAFLDERCRLRDISLRSCRCGDDFIIKCLPLENDDPDVAQALWSAANDTNHVGHTIRLGSKIHEGTAGRISEVGLSRLLKYLNTSLRVLDLEGCLDLEWYENSGDTVTRALEKHAMETEGQKLRSLPQLQELNLRSTGLTIEGMSILQTLKEKGQLGQAKIITDEQLRQSSPRKCLRRSMWSSSKWLLQR